MQQQELRNAFGCFPTGVVIATTRGDHGAPVGLTVSSFNSVSLDPPLILWSLALDAPSLGAFRNHESFVINILSDEQKELCLKFAEYAEDKFQNVSWTEGYGGAPVLCDAIATLECRVYRPYEGGDHEIYLGEVMNLSSVSSGDKMPLVYHRGEFCELTNTAA